MARACQDHAYIYVVSEPYYGGDLTTAAQRASQQGVSLNQHWLAGILRQVCVPWRGEQTLAVLYTTSLTHHAIAITYSPSYRLNKHTQYAAIYNECSP